MARILIIEDEVDLLAGLVTILEMEGYDVIDKTTGIEGIDEARRDPPDLIISDINLPLMSGLEVAHEICSDPGTTHIPIIMMTAYPDPDLQERAVAAGAAYLLRKPFDVDGLLNAVHNALNDG